VDLFLRPDEEPELAVRLGLAGPTASGRLRSGSPESPATWPPVLGAEDGGRVGPVGRSIADRLPRTRAAAVASHRVARRSATQAWIPIVYGCDKTCTYCVVPFTRGPERSRPFDEILSEATSLAEAGYREVMLLGQNVNSYGHDLPAEARFVDSGEARRIGPRIDRHGRPDIAALLRAIDGIRDPHGRPAIPRLRFITSHSWDLSDRLIRAMAECQSVCEHLHLPVQSGSDVVLRRMGRQYSVESYRDLIARLRGAVPGIGLTTDVIVGFPGETGEQFEETLALLREIRFDTVYAAAYSPRPGTPAAALPDDVPAGEKRGRLNALLAAQEAIGLERNQAWCGRITEVLVDESRAPRPHEHEQRHEPVPGEGVARLSGRARDNRLVHLDGPSGLVGRRVSVRIDRAGPYALAGSLVDDVPDGERA
jgi:tRNA-2-methylthio-N6-dimethylallyladenosine synthase